MPARKLLILGGTAEARGLARAAVDRFGETLDVITSLAGRTRNPAALPGGVRVGGFGGVARLVRITALEVQEEDFIRTARAKGLSESVVATRHVLPNSLLPLVTVVGFALASIIEGAFFVEVLLGIPGIGRFTFEAVVSRDYDVILAMTVITSGVFVLMNLIIEISYTFIDPRIRLGKSVRT